MDQSVFMDKNKKPSEFDLMESLGTTYSFWQKIREQVLSLYPGGLEEWSHSGAKYGWGFRIKDKKRAIVYLLPRDGYFKVAFVFGQKATELILQSQVSQEIKNELESARVYTEGRGIRIDVKEEAVLGDVFVLIEMKLKSVSG